MTENKNEARKHTTTTTTAVQESSKKSEEHQRVLYTFNDLLFGNFCANFYQPKI
jgi:hypothetical protein